MNRNIIRIIALIGALITSGTKAEEPAEPKPGLTVFAASEQDGLGRNHAEVTLKPDLTLEKGEYKVGYEGSFYRSKDTDGTERGWMTLASEIRAENEEWTLDIGRASTGTCAGYRHAPTTTGFDNQGMIKGTVRTYTGTILTHKETGLSLGQVASDTRMTPTHWDSTLVGWAKELSKEWTIHLQATGGRRPLSSAAATIKWQPDENTTVVAEGFYLSHEETGIMTANRKVTENLTLFAGAQITSPRTGKPEGVATAGASYNLGRGFQLVGAVHQELGTDRQTMAILGIKYAGDFRQR